MIRRLVPDDAPELARLLVANREFLAPFQPDPADDFFTAAGQRARLERSDNAYGIYDDGALAGTIALSNLTGAPFLSTSVGYWVAEERSGKGLATLAVSDLVDLAFAKLGLHRVEAATLVDNIASQRVLEKNHFTRIGVAPRYLRIAGAWRDHVLFQRTSEDP